jgi:hypothetical protein
VSRFGRRTDAHGYIHPADQPIVGMGFDLDDSETGDGAWRLMPFVNILACENGLVLTHRVARKPHLGMKLPGGVVTLSKDTVDKASALIAAQARDMVQEWLSLGFLSDSVRWLEAKSGAVLSNPQRVIATVAAVHAFTEAEQDAVLAHFTAGGQSTSGGVMQAVASVAQTIESPERAVEFERLAVPALGTAYEAATR